MLLKFGCAVLVVDDSHTSTIKVCSVVSATRPDWTSFAMESHLSETDECWHGAAALWAQTRPASWQNRTGDEELELTPGRYESSAGVKIELVLKESSDL